VRRSIVAVLWIACAGCGGGFHPLDLGTDGGTSTDAATLWSTVQDEPDGGALRAVWGSAPDDVHIVGDDGAIRDFDGTQWYAVQLGSGNQMSGVWGQSKNDVWAAGTIAVNGRGVLFHKTTDKWIQFGTTPLGLKSVWGIADQRWAVGVQGGIFSGDVNMPFATGVQAQPNPDVPPTLDAPINWQIAGNSLTSVMIAADVDTTFFWDGAMWHTYVDPVDRTRAFRSMFGLPSTSTDLWYGANYFGIWHFTGATNPVVQYHEEKDRPEDVARSIWSIWGDGARLIAVGDEGRIMIVDMQSMGVSTLPSPTPRSLYGVWGSSFADVYIVGEGGLILHGAVP
jgi:hypothetical protein